MHQNIQSDMSAKLFLQKIEMRKEISYNISIEKSENSDLILESISFSWDSNISYVIKNDFKKFEALLKKIFENQNISKISNDLKQDIKLLAQKNIRILGDIFDVKLAHYLINPDISHDFISISNNYLNLSIIKKIKELFNYEISCLAYRLKPLLMSDLVKFHQLELYNNIEIPLLKTLALMETEGINLDVKFLKNLSKRTTEELGKITKKIFELSGEEFNISSPKQLGEILFEKMKISDKPKKTKTGQYSTSEETLTELASKNDIVK